MEIFFLILFLLVNYCYIKIWRKFSSRVPTGVGILLIIPCFFYYFEQNLYFVNILFIFILSFVYFFDDLKEINFLWRILFQTLASLIIYFSLEIELNFIIIFLNLLTFLILTNTLNFQDGEDLHIATLLIIIFSIFYFYAENKSVQNTAEIILFFLISFSLFNSKKKFLYFGDSGCFIVSIIILLFIYSELQNTMLIKLFIAAIIFPIIDVFYVVIYRIIKKENLLFRNYLHLYQIIAQKINLKLYLLPNILFSFLNIFISLHFSLGIAFVAFLFILNTVTLFAIRLIIIKFLQ